MFEWNLKKTLMGELSYLATQSIELTGLYLKKHKLVPRKTILLDEAERTLVLYLYVWMYLLLIFFFLKKNAQGP